MLIPELLLFQRRQDHLAPRPIITLTTDYGTNDHLVGTLKGVILKINPDVTIVDISHDVTPYDLLDGRHRGLFLFLFLPARFTWSWSIRGVGTERRPLLVTGDAQYFKRRTMGCSLVYERRKYLVRHNVAPFEPVAKTFTEDVFALWPRGSQGS
jgi:hypothetical protein